VCHDFIISLAQRSRGVIRRHHYYNFLAVYHETRPAIIVILIPQSREKNLELYSIGSLRQSRDVRVAQRERRLVTSLF